MQMQANPVFLDKVTTWQRKMGTMDLVLGTWFDMQKKWQALVSIFLGSADIRQQLPEDSLRFDSVNADYMVGTRIACIYGPTGSRCSLIESDY